MAEFLGTKGEIKVTEVMLGIAKGIYLSGQNQKHFLAQIITHNRTEEESLANAVLFSKAPEMLEALQKAIKLLENTTEFDVFDNYKIEVKEFKKLIKQATEF